MSEQFPFRLSPAAFAKIRKIMPEGEVVALYEAHDLTRPCDLYPRSEEWAALRIVRDSISSMYGVLIDEHGNVAGLEPGGLSMDTVEAALDRMVEAARGSFADGIAVIGAAAEYRDRFTRPECLREDGWHPMGEARPQVTELRRLYAEVCAREGVHTGEDAILSAQMNLSAAGLARVTRLLPFDGNQELVALYMWRDLSRPVAVYRENMKAMEHADRENLLGIAVRENGRIFGCETGPGRDVYFEDVVDSVIEAAGGKPPADALAILIAIAACWHHFEVAETTGHCWPGDVRPHIPESHWLIDLRRKHAEALASEMATA